MRQQLLPFLIFGIALAVALVIRQVLVRWMDRKATSKHAFAFVFLKSIRTPSVLWCFVAALEVALHNAPLSKDQVAGPYYQHQLMRVYLLVGENEKALDILEELVKIPYLLTPAWLRIDPNFEPLKGHPRFENLLRGA